MIQSRRKVNPIVFLLLLIICFFIIQNSLAQNLTQAEKRQRTILSNRKKLSSTWLRLVNYYRAKSNLSSVSNNKEYSDGCQKHSRYMYENNTIGHSEDKKNPWYTPEGDAAAKSSNVILGNKNDSEAIKGWMKAPYHAFGILNPRLKTVSFGSYYKDGKGAAALDVIRGINYEIPESSIDYPVKFPENGKSIDLLSYDGGERPNPLDCASGFKEPTGLPIIVLTNFKADVTNSSFKQNGKSMDHKVLDYKNCSYNSSSQIILIPRKPLQAKSRYSVSVSGSNEDENKDFGYSWTFSTSRQRAKLKLRKAAIVVWKGKIIKVKLEVSTRSTGMNGKKIIIKANGKKIKTGRMKKNYFYYFVKINKNTTYQAIFKGDKDFYPIKSNSLKVRLKNKK